MTAQQLIDAVRELQLISSPVTQRQVMIWLLQQLAGNTMTAQQLITAANQLQLVSNPVTADQVIIYLLENGAAGSGNGSPYGVINGTSGQTYLDMQTDNFWVNNGGGVNGWIELISS